MNDQQYKDCAEEILLKSEIGRKLTLGDVLDVVAILKKHFAFNLNSEEVPPDVDIVICKGKLIGMTEIECRRFHAFYESNGWKVGKNKMKSWKGALAGWALRRDPQNGNGGVQNGAGAVDKVQMSKERERIAERLKWLKGQASHDSWGAHYTDKQRDEILNLKRRDKELSEKLGVLI